MIFFGTFNGQKIYGRILAAELLEKIGLPDPIDNFLAEWIKEAAHRRT